jgi:3-hydroxybutyryl-CoA dehydrogenase
MEIRTLGVIGAGTVGHGVAQVAVHSGFRVLMRDVDERTLQQARLRIERGLERLVETGKLSAGQRTDLLKQVVTTTHLADLKGCDFIVEAAPEELAVKRGIFQELDRLCRPAVILASSTSSLSITRLGTVSRRPDRVIGMHFLIPVPVMPVVELIRGLETSNETAATTREIAKRLGKLVVEARDAPGFLANRILMPMINEAVFALMEGVGTVDAIDTIAHLGMKHPMGPLALADLIGLDVCLAVLRSLQADTGDPKFRPAPLLARMVDAGHLGRKTGRGFYTHA